MAVGAAQSPEEMVGVDAGCGYNAAHRSGADRPAAVIYQSYIIAVGISHIDVATPLSGAPVAKPLQQDNSLGESDIANQRRHLALYPNHSGFHFAADGFPFARDRIFIVGPPFRSGCKL